MKFLDQEIAPQGMGCWAIGGEMSRDGLSFGYAGADDDAATRAIHAALEAGIRVFDTAGVYGTGHSEHLLGAALENHPEAIIISKLGIGFDEQSRQILDDQTDAAAVMPAIDASLQRLRRDRLDVMLLHLNSLPVDVAMPIFDQMELARSMGKIGAYGWSTDYPASVAAMAGREGFIGVEHAMNVFEDVPTIQATIAQHHLTALIRSPLAMGVLTGKFTADSRVAKNDVRARNNDWKGYFHDGRVDARYLANLDAVRELLKTGGRSLAQGALCWLMAKSERNLPLPGARNVEQVQDNAGAIERGPLPATVMAEIEQQLSRQPEGPPRDR